MTDPDAVDEREVFAARVRPLERALRAYLHRLVASPDDAADLAQETLLRAFRERAAFRGEASFKTWLFRIATNAALDHLRARRRWTEDAQDRARAAAQADPGFRPALRALVASSPATEYEMREHVDHCFACIGRTLPPERQAALLLREVHDCTDEEGAAVLGTTLAVFKHLVHDARATMTRLFEQRCALVNQTGPCWQCRELADLLRGGEIAARQAAALPLGPGAAGTLDARLTLLRTLDPHAGVGRRLHAFLHHQLRDANGHD